MNKILNDYKIPLLKSEQDKYKRLSNQTSSESMQINRINKGYKLLRKSGWEAKNKIINKGSLAYILTSIADYKVSNYIAKAPLYCWDLTKQHYQRRWGFGNEKAECNSCKHTNIFVNGHSCNEIDISIYYSKKRMIFIKSNS